MFNNDILLNVQNLPDELIDMIKEFIPNHIFIFTNKINYNLYHFCIKKTIIRYEDYIRDTVMRDNIFVFEYIVNENYAKWINNKNYNYKNIIFNNYLFFIIHYCIENDSQKCANFIASFAKQQGLCKNLHKKNIIKHIRWKN